MSGSGMKAVYIPEGVVVAPNRRGGRCQCREQARWMWNKEKICSKCLIEVKLASQKEQIGFVTSFVKMMKGGKDDRTREDGTLTREGYDQLAIVIVRTTAGIRKVPKVKVS